MNCRVYFSLMKTAVVGAGFCGLASAYYVAKLLGHKVTLFDKTSIGAGASGIAAGLLHCYSGPKAKLSWEGHSALAAALELLDIASKAKGHPVYSQSGIFRPQIAGMDYSQVLDYPDVEWWDRGIAQKKIPGLDDYPGIFIRSGVTVDCRAYIQALWLACEAVGVGFEKAQVTTAGDLTGFDKIIFTVGAGQNELQGVNHPPISLIKGQTLELDWPYDSPLPFAINSGVQFSQISPNSVWAGATYERKWQTEGIDPQAEDEIRKKISYFSNTFAKLPLKSIYASFRAATGDKKPFIAATTPNIYSIGGMGSKGLLYHAFMAKQLTRLA